MTCKVCGDAVADANTYWCLMHHSMWKESAERRRHARPGRGAYVAVVDFTTRVRAERENGGRPGSEALPPAS